MTRRRERRERIKYNRMRRATRVYSHSPTPPQWDALARGVVFHRFGVAHLHIRLGGWPIEVPCEHVITDKCLADPDSDWSGV